MLICDDVLYAHRPKKKQFKEAEYNDGILEIVGVSTIYNMGLVRYAQLYVYTIVSRYACSLQNVPCWSFPEHFVVKKKLVKILVSQELH